MEIIEKSFRVNFDRIDEGYLYPEITCYAKGFGEAKSKLLPEASDLGLRLVDSGDEVNYLNLPIRRNKEDDKVSHQGTVLTRYRMKLVQRLEEHNANLDKLLEDKTTTHCFIRKRGLYYCEKYNGYTEQRFNAGVYPIKDGVSHCKNTEELSCIPINTKEHNEYIQSIIKKLKTKLIPE